LNILIGENFIYVVLFLILLIAVSFDLLYKKIPNWLTIPAGFFGISYHFFNTGLNGLCYSLVGILIGIGVLILFYLKGGMGAGDVKLMGALGAFLGGIGVFIAFLATSIIGGAYAILTLVYHGQLRVTSKRYINMLKTFFLTKQLLYIPPGETVRGIKLPYGVAIALGTTVAILLINTFLLGGLR
jgi:prepilin peptidase CpaA